MHVLRHAPEVSAFIQTYPDRAVTTLIQQRLADLLADDDLTMEELVFFVVPEPGEGVADIEAAIGTQLFTLDAQPLWEVIEKHSSCFELVMVLESSGYGAIVFVPDGPAMNADLFSLCQQHAVPVKEGIDP